jgi:protein-S-isoprenylcysteine O-methyltransferase Ste14
MIYVVVQFTCIIYLAINAQLANFSFLSYFLILLSAVVGGVAIINMRPGNLNIVPTLKDKHQLITIGIYTYIRHPMYSSVLLFCLALMLSNAHLIAQLVMLVLLVDLILKSSLEEKLLLNRFDQYQNYKKNTGRFLPKPLNK